MSKIQHILVPVDGSEHAAKAVAQAVALAVGSAAAITLLYVTNIQSTAVDSYLLDEILESHRHLGENVLNSAREKIPTCIAVETQLKEGHPSDTIVDFARETGADLIVIGSRGLGGFSGLLLGSVSQYVIQHAECSVLVCK